MQEIAPNVFIENNSLGMVTGVIRTEAGSVLVDSLSRQDDVRSWRSGTAKLVMGEPKFLISLDTNYDRILSSKGTSCVIITHRNSLTVPRTRAASQKSADENLGSNDPYDSQVSSLRWIPPEIVFDSSLSLHLGEMDLLLEHHAGSNTSGIWVILAQQKVIFVGDTVVVDQPPFLAYADLAIWQEDLKVLASRRYKSYQIVSARSGIVSVEQVREMNKLIGAIRSLLTPLIDRQAALEDYYELIPKIMKRINYLSATEELCANRLRWGLTTWYEQNQRVMKEA